MIEMSSTFKLAFPSLLLLALIAISPLCNGLTIQPACQVLPWIVVPVLALTIRLSTISMLALIALLTLQAQWGIVQFIFQHDLGLHLIGESVLSTATPAVAKFAVAGTRLIRAYGPYPHANIFGGMMVIATTLILFLKQRVLRRWILPIVFIGLVLSFSRSAYIGGLIVLLILLYKQHMRRWMPTTLIALTLSPLILFRFIDTEDRAFMERVRGYAWAIEILSNQPIATGIGIGHYQSTLQVFLTDKHVSYNLWEIAPVHSAPLLLLVEFGLLPTAALIGLLLAFTPPDRYVLLTATTPALLLDHYFLTNIAAFTLLGLLLCAHIRTRHIA